MVVLILGYALLGVDSPRLFDNFFGDWLDNLYLSKDTQISPALFSKLFFLKLLSEKLVVFFIGDFLGNSKRDGLGFSMEVSSPKLLPDNSFKSFSKLLSEVIIFFDNFLGNSNRDGLGFSVHLFEFVWKFGLVRF